MPFTSAVHKRVNMISLMRVWDLPGNIFSPSKLANELIAQLSRSEKAARPIDGCDFPVG